MSTQQFLEFCITGDVNSIKQLKSSNDPRNFIYACDPQGHNGLHLAVLNGHWSLAMHLLRDLHISPHKLTEDGESIFHSIARGLKVREATDQDFAEVRELNLKYWQEEKERGLKKIEERKAAHPDLKAPENLVLKNVEKEDENLFGNPNLTVAKYILRKYHVVLKHNNSMGHSPADLAESLQIQDLAEYYRLELTPHMIRRRLIAGLNENLFREIVLCL
ncbi:unnamed protein product [Blepharisma stoltei]|uniref:Uncharacterized protein n=1 Tax=Blepharisma stoltei TaxID=1481888 RepID=A0AAU9ITF5_9CILI|nr:unnamed protein product [Blepharisma stoltei]